MKYPVLISQIEEKSQWQMEMPDLPGCKLIEETMDLLFDKAEQAIADHLSILTEYGEAIPHASTIDFHRSNRDKNDVIWAIIDFDIVPYLGKSHKINVTLPELLIKQIDDRVSKSEQYKTRSGFIASACIKQLTKSNQNLR